MRRVDFLLHISHIYLTERLDRLQVKKEKGDIRSAYLQFYFFLETVNFPNLETTNHISHFIFVLHRAMKPHSTNQNARTYLGDIFSTHKHPYRPVFQYNIFLRAWELDYHNVGIESVFRYHSWRCSLTSHSSVPSGRLFWL